MTPDYFVHESSYVDDGALIGVGTKIWHFCHVMSGARIGSRCNIGQNVFVAPDVVIGDNVKIQNNVSIYTGVTLEDDVFLGPSMTFTNVTNPRSHVPRKDEYRPTLVKRGVSIGANATIVCGVTLGEYAFVGAGAVVTHDLPAYALVYGNPAPVIPPPPPPANETAPIAVDAAMIQPAAQSDQSAEISRGANDAKGS